MNLIETVGSMKKEQFLDFIREIYEAGRADAVDVDNDPPDEYLASVAADAAHFNYFEGSE